MIKRKTPFCFKPPKIMRLYSFAAPTILCIKKKTLPKNERDANF